MGDRGLHLATDLADPEALAGAARRLRHRLSEAPAGEVLLVNNAGFGDYGPKPSLDVDKQLKMIDLNIRAGVDLTLRLLPALRARGGCVVNVASTAAYQPTPYLATYGATKAFVLNWSLALNDDLRGTGVRALAVCPGPTRTNFFKAAGFESAPMGDGKGLNAWLAMSADEVAAQTLRAVERGRAVLINGWTNRLIAIFGGTLPKTWVTRVGGAILRRMRLERHGKGGAV